VAGDRAVVVESQQRDHVAHVGLVGDPARGEARPARKDRVVVDASLGEQLLPHLSGEAEVRGVLTVQVTDLAPPEAERELAALPRAGLDAGPGGDLLGDLPAGGAYSVMVGLLESGSKDETQD
jgi:hypothetical protein